MANRAQLTIKADAKGCVILPKKFPKALENKPLNAEFGRKKLLLKPAPTWGDLKGTLPKLNMESFRKEHNQDWK